MPRKLGQHFLIRDAVLERLAAAACGDHAPRVIEIGAGRGALTRHLLPRCDELHALEIDPSLVEYLGVEFAGEPKLHIHSGDVLATDLTHWGPAAIAGNLPYYITSPIIERFLVLDARFPIAMFLVQWEVAARLIAQPGTRAYGYLTVVSRLLCDVELVCRVPAAAFAPPPQVDSGAVRFRRKAAVPSNLPELLAFVSHCFRQKRKTLRNNLRPFYGRLADEIPEAGLRAEQLTVEQIQELQARLTAAG